MDCSPPGSSIHGISQTKVREWVAFSFSRGSSHPGDHTRGFRIAGRLFIVWATREAFPSELVPSDGGWLIPLAGLGIAAYHWLLGRAYPWSVRCAPLQEQLKFLWNSGFLAKSGWYHRGTFFNNYTHFCLSQLGRVYAWHPVTGAGILLDILQSTSRTAPHKLSGPTWK